MHCFGNTNNVLNKGLNFKVITLLTDLFFLFFLIITKYCLLMKTNQKKNDHILLFTIHIRLTTEYCWDLVTVRVDERGLSPTLLLGK